MQRHVSENTDALELQALTGTPEEDNVSRVTSYHSRSSASNPATSVAIKIRRYLGGRFTGWRFGALSCAILASTAFIINLTVTIWGSVSHQSSELDGSTDESRFVLFEGDCAQVKNTNTGIHVLINLLSTVLLSGSNYCMQCLSAPTRRDVDAAHAKKNWLDIGVLSFRNLRHISALRVLLWGLLAVTSLPLHLFYNSAVFASIASNSYYTYSISQSFLESTECHNCTTSTTEYPGFRQRGEVLVTMWNKAREGKLDRLENADCIDQYAKTIQSNRRSVLLVADDEHFPPPAENPFRNGSNVYDWSVFDTFELRSSVNEAADVYSWICSGLDDYRSKGGSPACVDYIDTVKNAPEAWRVSLWSWPVQYCLSEKAEPHCQLRFNLGIMILVTILNFTKAALMFFVAFSVPEEPLLTIGDATASFLEVEDPTTMDICLSSLKDFRKKRCKPGAKVWEDSRSKWKDVTSKSRRITTVTLFLVALAIVTILLSWGLRYMPRGQSKTLSALARLGYGAVDPRTVISTDYFPMSIAGNAVIANFPQVILSVLYFSYNALFTAMLLGYEWISYAHKRKGLRLSRLPSGEQRSTYFLQLPYRFGIPLMVLSGLLHWLVSQSIFVVSIDFYDALGRFGAGRVINSNFIPYIVTCGFSPIAIVSVIIVGSSMVLAIVGFGFIPYKRGMTLAGSCSMAISAACHPSDREVNGAGETAIWEQKLQWGVVSTNSDEIGHCAFSSLDVEPPVKGQLYAGSF